MNQRNKMKRHFLKLFSTLLTIVIVLTPLFGQSWTEHTIDAAFTGAHSVYAVDVDGDGDMDVLGAASVDDYIVGGKTMAAPLTTREVTATPGQ
jgi:hypothetical protein